MTTKRSIARNRKFCRTQDLTVMGFPSTYIVGGNKRDQVRQYGQAVTPPASAVLLGRVFEAMS